MTPSVLIDHLHNAGDLGFVTHPLVGTAARARGLRRTAYQPMLFARPSPATYTGHSYDAQRAGIAHHRLASVLGGRPEPGPVLLGGIVADRGGEVQALSA